MKEVVRGVCTKASRKGLDYIPGTRVAQRSNQNKIRCRMGVVSEHWYRRSRRGTRIGPWTTRAAG